MCFAKFMLPAVLVVLAGCTPTGSMTAPLDLKPAASPGGAGPPPGRTQSERQARKDYYRGPRGDEF